MTAPDATIAAVRPAAQPSTPNASMPAMPPPRSQRARAVSSRAIRSGWPSSPVSHATSAPPEHAQPSAHSTWLSSSSGNAVTRPVSSMPAARNPCPSTSGHFRLNASDHTPAGMSDTVSVTAMPVPSSTSWAADRWAWVTKYRLEVST
jgi:hypothetical protein